MDVERLIVRMVADTSLYTRALDGAQARLLYFSTAITEGFVRQAAVAAATYEKSGIAFEVMTKSAATAKALLNDLNQMAVETPFHSAELIDYTKQLSSFGIETKQIIPTLTVLGEIASATNSRVDRLVLAFGQVKSIGRLMGQELRQFTNAGVPMVEALAHVMQKPTDQIINLIHMGQVGFPDVVRALNYLTTAGGRFAGMMERVNKETTAGHWESMTERISVATRKVALSFFQGFGINDLLDRLGMAVGGDVSAEDAGLVKFFREARNWINATVFALQRLGSEGLRILTDAAAWTQRWAERNRELMTVVALTVGTLLIFAATVRTVAFALGVITFALRLLTLGVITLRSALIITMAVQAFGSAIAALGALVGAILSPLGLLVINIGLLIALFRQLGTFDGLGSRLLDTIERLAPAFKSAWSGITDAISSGDLELAMKIAVTGMETIWNFGLARMEGEWERLKGGIGLGTENAVHWTRTWATKIRAGATGTWNSIVTQDPREQAWAQEWSRMHLKELEDRHRLMLEANKATTDARTRALNDSAIAELEQATKELRHLQERARIGRIAIGGLDSETGRNIFQFNRGILGNANAMIPAEWSRDKFGRSEGSWAPGEMHMPVYPGGGVVPPGGGLGAITGVAFGEAKYRDLWKNAATSIMAYNDAIAAGDKVPKAALENLRREANQTVAVLDQFSESITGIKKAAGIAEPLQISAAARDAVHQLYKDILHNVQPYDQFQKQMELLQEAYRGPLPGAGAVLGGFGTATGAAAGSLTPDQFKAGLFMEYEKLAKSGKSPFGNLAPAAFRGSREAAEVVNRNMDQGLNIQQQMLQQITIARTTAEQHAEYARQAKDFLGRIAASPSGKVKEP